MQIILLIGTKLQVIITRMALQIMDRGDVVKGVPVVHPKDDLFWFNRPTLILFLIQFVLFQVIFFSQTNTYNHSNHVHQWLKLLNVHLFVIFQNAFQIAFLAWSLVRHWTRSFIWGDTIYCTLITGLKLLQYEFGYPSCFHKNVQDMIIRITMG